MEEKVGLLQSEQWVQSISLQDHHAYRLSEILCFPLNVKEWVTLNVFTWALSSYWKLQADFYLVIKYKSNIAALAGSM